MTDIDELLNQKQIEHGSFSDNARNYCQQKRVDGIPRPGYLALIEAQGSVLDVIEAGDDMIRMKRARIQSTPLLIDHWDDLAGYATLVANELRALSRKERITMNDYIDTLLEQADSGEEVVLRFPSSEEAVSFRHACYRRRKKTGCGQLVIIQMPSSKELLFKRRTLPELPNVVDVVERELE